MKPAPLSLPAPELSIYRDLCVALLRRYFSMAVEVGRLPAILGRECFRARARSYQVHSFEDTVVFVIDIERCLDRLHPFDKELVAYVILQEYTEEEAARLLHCGLRTLKRRLPEALDVLTEMFLRAGMLNLAEEVVRELARDDGRARCRNRVPQRARKDVSLQACAADSQVDTPLVKSPRSSKFPQTTRRQANIVGIIYLANHMKTDNVESAVTVARS